MQPQPKTLADLLALTGMHVFTHPQHADVELYVLADRNPAGQLVFAVYAYVQGADESRVAELAGLTPDCELHTAVTMLESVRGPSSSWPTLTESLA
jgi:hypothetical protein